jgi:hypothetical protein
MMKYKMSQSEYYLCYQGLWKQKNAIIRLCAGVEARPPNIMGWLSDADLCSLVLANKIPSFEGIGSCQDADGF